MLESTIQQDISCLLHNIEELAIDADVKLRMIDSIRDLNQKTKKKMSSHALRELMLEIDEIMERLRKQLVPENKDIRVNDITTVKDSEIKEQIQQVLIECGKLNKTLALENMSGCKTYIVDVERAISDLGNAEANYEMLLDPIKFRDFFEHIGKKFNNDIGKKTNQYVEEVNRNYDQGIKKIGIMFSGIEDKRIKFGQKELYHQWSQDYERINNQLKGEIASIDKGGSEIIRFGNEQEKVITKQVKKIQKKYTRIKRIPLYLILFVLLGFLVSNIIEIVDTFQQRKENMETISTQMEEQDGAALIESLMKPIGEIIASTNSNNSNESSIGNILILFVVLIPLLPYIVVGCLIWYLVIRTLNKRCKKRICSVIGMYLREQIKIFCHEEFILNRLEESYKEIVGKVTATYEARLNSIFETILYDERKDPNSIAGRMLQLCSEWEKIKRGNI